MQYNFFIKKLGHVDFNLVEKIRKALVTRVYTATPDFNPEVILVNSLSGKSSYEIEIFEELLVNNLDILFDRHKLMNMTVSMMLPNTYLLEHSDTVSIERVQNFHKIHIPITTNDKVGHMWRDLIHPFHMDIGGIYLFDNMRKHSVVNLSSEPRHNIIVRYNSGAELDPHTLL